MKPRPIVQADLCQMEDADWSQISPPGARFPDVWSLSRWESFLGNKGKVLVVGSQAKVGYIAFKQLKGRLLIERLSVHTEIQRNGIATVLVEQIRLRLREARPIIDFEVFDYLTSIHLFLKSFQSPFRAVEVMGRYVQKKQGCDFYTFRCFWGDDEN